MKFYPYTFYPGYKEKIWGGNNLKRIFDRSLPERNIGESWDLTVHEEGKSIISNGFYKGQHFHKLLEKYPECLLGKKVGFEKNGEFPLLFKIIDANDKLSVQVHPGDEYAYKVEGESGKTEMWYVIDAKPDARLVYGVKEGINKEKFKKAVKEENLREYLNEVKVKAGDVFFIPSGTVHAIEDGIVLAEIQQNSDTTYRVYDWGRVDEKGRGRPLHIKKALDVIDFNRNYPAEGSLEIDSTNLVQRELLAACRYFIVEKLKIYKDYMLNLSGERFYIFTNLKGSGKIYYHNEEYIFKSGMTYFLPACLDIIRISGRVEGLLSYLPLSKNKFTSKLKSIGFSQEEMKALPGFSSWE